MKLYRLDNIHQNEQARKSNCQGDIKLIGYFKKKQECQRVIEILIAKPGFNLPNAKFKIHKVHIIGRVSNPSIVYRLTHEFFDGQYDYISEIGIFAQKEKAENKMNKLCKRRKFKINPKGFSIDEVSVGQTGWREGFVAWDDQ